MAVLGEKVIWFCPQQMCPEFWTIFLLYFLINVSLLALFWPYNRIDTKQIAILIACLALNEYFRHISIPWAITRKKYETFKCCVSTIKCNTFVTHITSTALSYYLARQRRETKGGDLLWNLCRSFCRGLWKQALLLCTLKVAGCLLQPNVERLWVLAFNEPLDFAILSTFDFVSCFELRSRIFILFLKFCIALIEN